MDSYKYAVANLNTDECHYASNGADLDTLIEEMIDAGVAHGDIGISLEKVDSDSLHYLLR